MEKKYALIEDDTIEIGNKILYRIKALKDINEINVLKEDLGGYVQSESNLSHKGSCWIFDKAKVYGGARVCDNAKVYGKAQVYNTAQIHDRAKIHGNAKVYGHADVYGSAEIYGNAKVYGSAILDGNANIYGNAKVYDRGCVTDYTCVDGNAEIHDYATVHGDIYIGDNAEVCGGAGLYGKLVLCGDAKVCESADIASITHFGSCNRGTTFFMCKDGNVRVNCGCFYGTIEEFKKRVKTTHGDNYLAQEYLMIAELMEFRFKNRQNN